MDAAGEKRPAASRRRLQRESDANMSAAPQSASSPSDGAKPRRVLLLGGTREARLLAAQLAQTPEIAATLSLAGRTSAPIATHLPTRVGGFGGVEGLKRYIVEERIERVVDATHPFAERISANARAACAALGVPLAVLQRAPWERRPGDRWIEVSDNAQAAAALGEPPRRVFLTIGRLGVRAFQAAPQHHYLLRSIEPPAPDELPPETKIVLARGPFAVGEEIALMRDERIDVVVTKNSGGPLTYAKIEAARALGLGVVVVAPPAAAGASRLADMDAALAFLRAPLG
jgi:precorrin-6A/cobalt-precorrin-6A reductase